MGLGHKGSTLRRDSPPTYWVFTTIGSMEMLKTPWTTSPGSFSTLRGQKLFRGNSILPLVSANSFFWSLSTDHDHRWRVCRSTGRLFFYGELSPYTNRQVQNPLTADTTPVHLSLNFRLTWETPKILKLPHLGLQLIPSGRSTLLWHRTSVSDSTRALWSKFCCGSRFGDIIQQ